MLSVPVYNPSGEKLAEESIDPADFGGEVNKQLLHDVVLMHRAARRVGTVNTRGRADVAGSGKKLFRPTPAPRRAGRKRGAPERGRPPPPGRGQGEQKGGGGGGPLPPAATATTA